MNKKDVVFLTTKGLRPSRALMCGISKENASEFISEFDFYNLHNYKGIEFSDWFDNKLNTYFLLCPFKDFIPKHYFYLSYSDNIQKIYRLDADNSFFGDSLDAIKDILNSSDIALKKCRGGHGEGFIKLSQRDGSFYKNDVIIKEDELRETIKGLDGYLVTKFIKPQQGLRKLCGENSFAVMRVITLYSQETQSSEVAAIIIRLGTKKSGPTQAAHDHIYAGVDMTSGVLFDPIYEESDYKFFHTDIHPETKQSIVVYKIPNVDKLKSIVCEIAEYLPMTPYLVFDVIPTENSFSILEINSHGQPFIVEPYYRLVNNRTFRNIFELHN